MSALQPSPNGPSRQGLPPGFEPQLDAILLLGECGEARIDELIELGLLRIVNLRTSTPGASRNIRVAHTSEDALAQLLEFEPPPRNVVVERIAGGGFSLEEAQAVAQRVATSTLNRVTFAMSGGAWVRHAIHNLPELCSARPASELSGTAHGRAAILVSPGPSLEKNINALSDIRSKAIILAGNRALRPLRERGITPDIVVVSDPLNLRYQLDGGLLDGVKAIVLDVVAHPEVWDLDGPTKYFYSTVREVYELGPSAFGAASRLRSGGSVATVSLSLAVLLDADPIVLVGQDLALSGDRYYVPTAPDGDTRIHLEGMSGTFHNSSQELKEALAELGSTPLTAQAVQNFVSVPGYSGGSVITSRQFDTYRKWFGDEAARLRPERQFINATEGGAQIENMQNARLTEVIHMLPEATAPVQFPAAPSELEVRRGRKTVLAHVEHLQARLREAQACADECLRLARQATTSESALARLGSAERRLGAVTTELPFLIAIGSAKIEIARRAASNAKSLAESLEAASAIFRVVRDAAETTLPLLARAKRSVK
jgi:hypothetical protein